MDYLNNLLDGLWALRYLLIVGVVGFLGAALADAVGDRDEAQDENADLRARNDRLRRENAELRARLTVAQHRANRRKPIIAGRVVS